MKLIKFSSLITFVLVLDFTSALYFHIAEGERKCFIEEIPYDTDVVVNYNVELFDPRSGGLMPSSPDIGIHVKISAPDRVLLTRIYFSNKERIFFTSTYSGEHVLCIRSSSKSSLNGSLLRVHLDIQTGQHAVDYDIVAKNKKLNEMQLRITQLLDQLQQITNEQRYQKNREESFREISESTNSRVMWCSVLQTVILIVTIIFHC